MSFVTDAVSQVWTLESVLKWATDDFRARGISSPRLDAELLLAHATGATRVELFTDSRRPLSPKELAAFRETVKRRRAHEPIAYILGQREFFGRNFRVDSRVLIPRPDTETLVEVALKRTVARSLSLRALDVCTGSGCVAITIARERRTSRVRATDISEGAIAVARENALRLGAYNLSLSVGDLFEGITGPFDLITANPPYIPAGELPTLDADIREHEPHLALVGGDDGLSVTKRIVEEAPRLLERGGVLAIELGYGAAAAVSDLFSAAFEEVEVAQDYGRIDRVVSGKLR